MNSDCPQLDLVSLLIDDELTDQERTRLVEHLEDCEACARELDDMKRLRSALSRVDTDHTAKDRILRSLPPLTPRLAFVGRRVSVPLPIAAAILLLLGLSAIGNAYWGFRRPYHAQGAYSSVGLSEPKSEPNPGAMGEKNPNEPAAGQVTAGSLKIDSGPARQGNKKAMPAAPGPTAKPFVVTLQSERWTVEFVTRTEYRPYAVPKIYIGSINPSEQR